jgi:lipid-A-disaccharide synthase
VSRIFFVAGETSGDIHGSNLIRALRARDPDLVCEGLGGKLMAEAGMDLRYDLAENAIMGFSEVIRSFGLIRRMFNETVAHLEQTRPDCLLLIDYPGFNLRLAKRAKALGIPVVYYISPQIWAWKKGRIHTLAEVCAKMLVILPFEEKLYEKVGLPCRYVGHPLLDHIPTVQVEGAYADDFVIGLLPGSRAQEIHRLMPAMVEIARGIREKHPGARFVIPCVDAEREVQVRAEIGDFPIETVVGNFYEVLSAARFCLVASGTATLETALFGVPMLIMYKVSLLNYWIARALVDIEHIGLVNILAGRRIIPEFIQHEACTETVLPEALNLIDDTPQREEMLTSLAEVRDMLGGPGASDRAAVEILEVVSGSKHG